MLHVANTFFEWELEQTASPLLEKAMTRRHPIFLQLQFLPLLYAPAEDKILVGYLPALPPSERYHLLSETPSAETSIKGWGASRMLAKWASKHSCLYETPSWDLLCEMNAKTFSLAYAPKLPGAALLHHQLEAAEWIAKTKGLRVLKTCFGVSGKGHCLFTQHSLEVDIFLQREWSQKRSVIGEPWVPRVLDFSTQWMIHKNPSSIEYLGATRCQNTPEGQYLSSSVGDPHILFGPYLHFLEAHQEVALSLLNRMAEKGYFGPVGIDAMIYLESGTPRLHPIVEINARRTMGWVALCFQQQHYPNQTLQMQYTTTSSGLLPSAVMLSKEKKLSFSRNVVFNSIPH